MFDHRFKVIVLETLSAILNELTAMRAEATQLGAAIMHNIDEVLADIQEETTMVEGVGVFIQNMRDEFAKQLAAAGGIPADVQAKIDQAFSQLEANKGRLAAALGTKPDGTAAPVTDTPQPVTDSSTGTISSGAETTGSGAETTAGIGAAPEGGEVDATTGKSVG